MNASTAKPATDAQAFGTTRVELKHPVTVNGLTCAHLDLRRPKVRDLLHAEKSADNDAEREVIQFASLAGVPPNLIEELDMADYAALQEVVTSFLPSPKKTRGGRA